MMVSERVPIVVRGLAVFFAFIAVATASTGHAKSCTYGDEAYDSTSQLNFLVATGVLVILSVSARIALFDVRKHRLPSVNVLLALEALFLVFTFAAAIAVALSPVGSTICTGDDALKHLLQEACAVSCSNVLGSVATTFLTFACFLVSMLFTTNVIQTTSAAARAAEDLAYAGETGTPRARKIKQQQLANSTIGQV